MDIGCEDAPDAGGDTNMKILDYMVFGIVIIGLCIITCITWGVILILPPLLKWLSVN